MPYRLTDPSSAPTFDSDFQYVPYEYKHQRFDFWIWRNPEFSAHLNSPYRFKKGKERDAEVRRKKEELLQLSVPTF